MNADPDINNDCDSLYTQAEKATLRKLQQTKRMQLRCRLPSCPGRDVSGCKQMCLSIVSLFVRFIFNFKLQPVAGIIFP
jgi:hypothetical protein